MRKKERSKARATLGWEELCVKRLGARKLSPVARGIRRQTHPNIKSKQYMTPLIGCDHNAIDRNEHSVNQVKFPQFRPFFTDEWMRKRFGSIDEKGTIYAVVQAARCAVAISAPVHSKNSFPTLAGPHLSLPSFYF